MSVESLELKKETLPSVETEVSMLEKGEIEETRTFAGYYPIEWVSIKDDGKALFKPEGDFYDAYPKKGELRSKLEVLARSVDRALGFDLVPEVVTRRIGDKNGALQRLVAGKTAINFIPEKLKALLGDQIEKAATFDFLIDARDRTYYNFLIDEVKSKLWLIDHDYYMLLGTKNSTRLVDMAVSNNLELSEDVLESVRGLSEQMDGWIENATHEDIKILLEGIKSRCLSLLETRRLA